MHRRSGSTRAAPSAVGNLGLGARSLARNRVGRIVEVRVGALSNVADVHVIDTHVALALRRAGPGAILCADYRRVSPVSGEVADAWAHRMRMANKRILGAMIVLDPTNAMFNLQVARVVRCAGNPARRLVTGLGEMQAWLGDSLSVAEWRAIETFLADGGA